MSMMAAPQQSRSQPPHSLSTVSALVPKHSKAEIDFVRLLARCEHRVVELNHNLSSSEQPVDHGDCDADAAKLTTTLHELHQYTASLWLQLQKLERSFAAAKALGEKTDELGALSKETLLEYRARLVALDGNLKAVHRRQLMAAEAARAHERQQQRLQDEIDSRAVELREHDKLVESSSSSSSTLLASGDDTTPSRHLEHEHQQRQQQQQPNHEQHVDRWHSERAKLLASVLQLPGDAAARQLEERSLEERIQYHRVRQEELAAEILRATQRLKETSRLAFELIRQDVAKIERVESATEDNISRVVAERARVAAQAKSAARRNMVIWVLMLVVMMSFMSMYSLMRIAPRSPRSWLPFL